MKDQGVRTDPRRVDRSVEPTLMADAIYSAGEAAGPVRVLEAGCGHRWPFPLEHEVELNITGIDANADALRVRREERGDLDEEILGDLREVSIPREAFDVAYCSFVLEHVEGAEKALDNIAGGVRPHGRLVLRIPDGDSVFGWAARTTPHRTHVWFKRYVERKPNAGKPGYGPYPTVYDPVVSRRGIHDWAHRNGWKIVDEWATNQYLESLGALEPLARRVADLIAWLSRGKLTSSHNNLGFVLEKIG